MKTGAKHSADSKAKMRAAASKKPQRQPHSPETIEKIRARAIGRKASEETCLKISIANSNPSAETRAKQSAARKGRVNSEETRARIKAALLHPDMAVKLASFAGRKHSDETLRKMSENNAMHKEEERAKVSAALRGKPKSEEQKAKQSASMKGRTLSAEHRAKCGRKGRTSNMKGKTHKDSTRSKMSASQKLLYADPDHRAKCLLAKPRGVDNPRWGKPPLHKKRVWYGGVCFRSTYEVRFVKSLNARSVAWEYEEHRFNLGSCTYLPDFYLPSQDAYYEVKGWMGPDSIRKIALFRQQYPETPLVVVTKPVLELFESSIPKSAEMAKQEPVCQRQE